MNIPLPSNQIPFKLLLKLYYYCLKNMTILVIMNTFRFC